MQVSTFKLDNGLQVLTHEIPDHPLACCCVAYHVGAIHEQPNKTGLAHFLEHMMFEGSKHIRYYDQHIQTAGGISNAFTSSDYTFYYAQLPILNLEQAFWLESDRMLGLSWDENKFELQKKVVLEEYKQRYLNQPYGTAWHHIRRLAYLKHPYSWPVIGRDMSHIEQTTMEDLMVFRAKHYLPSRAYLILAGGFDTDKVKPLVQKWFGDIPDGGGIDLEIIPEPQQLEIRHAKLTEQVTHRALYIAFKMPGMFEKGYFSAILLIQILGQGKGSILFQSLVKKKAIFTSIQTRMTNSFMEGLFVIEGRVFPEVDLPSAEQALFGILENCLTNINEDMLEQAKNKLLTAKYLQDYHLLNQCVRAAQYTLQNKLHELSQFEASISEITLEQIRENGARILNLKAYSMLQYT